MPTPSRMVGVKVEALAFLWSCTLGKSQAVDFMMNWAKVLP